MPAAGSDLRDTSYGYSYQKADLARPFVTTVERRGVTVASETNALDAGVVFASMWEDLDKVNEDLLGNVTVVTGTVAAAASLTGIFTVGYVLWMARGGVLVASVLSSMPAWRSFDPLPILQYAARNDEDETDDSLQSLVSEGA